MYNSAFTPSGPTYLVTTSALQMTSPNNVTATSYRIINITAALVRFAWQPAGTSNTLSAPSAPTASGATNVITLQANSVETFSLPPNMWIISSAVNSIEVTPGEGM